ncbi:site-specific integrase [uncultured Shimia sp.]|uniref:tyrosine-type recombinase/integrase n=1 Tax=uncultured Shimia sp. TaxID=573152 RepID=UPI00262B5C48|nr:site-specific integrase [uncultured Shimia sp.]
MARGMHLLTAKQVENAAPGSGVNDGGGLFLRVTAKGNKRWVFRYKRKGQKQKEMGLGGFPATTLAQARPKAAAVRDVLARGLDPVTEAAVQVAQEKAQAAAEAAKGVTFGAYADKFVEWKIAHSGFSNPKHTYQWRHTFKVHAAPLRDKPLADITRRDILPVLEELWECKHVTATRVRGRLENLFDHAIQNEAYHHDNPASWKLFNATLSAPKKLTHGHRSAMPRSEVFDFVTELRGREGCGALALKFAILTAARSGEVRLATWAEFDLERAIWSISAERMKAKREHVVPLSGDAIAVLERARSHCLSAPSPNDFVFQGVRVGKPLSDMTLRAVMRRMGREQYVPHGFRSTFRDWAANDTEFPRELAEEALAHQLGQVEKAYRREQAVERRRVLMEAWADFVSGRQVSGDAVVQLHARK